MTKRISIKVSDAKKEHLAADLVSATIDAGGHVDEGNFVSRAIEKNEHITEEYANEVMLPKIRNYVQAARDGLPNDGSVIATSVYAILATVDAVLVAISGQYHGISDSIKAKIKEVIDSLNAANGTLSTGRFSTDQWEALSAGGLNKTGVALNIVSILGNLSKTALNSTEYEGYFNELPAFTLVDFTLDEDNTLTDAITATDANGDVVTFELLSNSSYGNFTLNKNGSFAFTPPLDYYGNTSVLVNASDPYGGYAIQNVTLVVNSINDAPVAYNGTLTIPSGLFNITIALNATDVDNRITEYVIVSNFSSIALMSFNRSTGEGMFNGSLVAGANDTMRFYVLDEDGRSSKEATVTVIAEHGLVFRTDVDSITKSFAFYGNSIWHGNILTSFLSLQSSINAQSNLTVCANTVDPVRNLFEAIKANETDISLAPSRELFPAEEPFCFGDGTVGPGGKFLGEFAKYYASSGSPAIVGKFCALFSQSELQRTNGMSVVVCLSLDDLNDAVELLINKTNATIIAEKSQALRFALPAISGLECPGGYSGDALGNCNPDAGSRSVDEVLAIAFGGGSGGLCATGVVNSSLPIYDLVCS